MLHVVLDWQKIKDCFRKGIFLHFVASLSFFGFSVELEKWPF
jgi:hypothetical protein